MTEYEFITHRPFESVTIERVGKLCIQPDITPLESVHISAILAASYSNGWFCFKEYVDRHNLWRHFEREEA